MHPRLRPAASVTALAGALLLVGCSGAPSDGGSTGTSGAAAPQATAAALECADAGSASDAVEVTGSGSDAPEVEFPTPTEATETERTVVRTGSGAQVEQGQTVSLAYSIFDARNGKQVDSQGFTDTNPVTFTADPAQLLPGLVQSLLCAQEGERFAAVIPPSQAFGEDGSEQLGVEGGDSLVIVADLVEIVATQATGDAEELPDGFPEVTLAEDGQPTVAIPSADPPGELRIAASKVGDGETVADGDTVTVQYQGVLWRDGSVFDQSWGRGPTSFPTTGVVEGFGDALVGAKVGSQVVAIIPPEQGYGEEGTPDGSVKGTDTMVFVIDVLSTAHA